MSSGSDNDDRAGPAGGRDRKGAGDEFGNARGVVDLDHPFGDVAEEAPVVDLLEGLALLGVARDLADEQDHRDGILHGDVHAGRCVGGAGAARDEADAGLAGQLALAIGHHRRAAFLAADDGADRRIVQRVEHGKIAFAGHAEDALDAVGFQRLDDQLSAGFHSSALLQFGKDFGRVFAKPRRGAVIDERRLRHHHRRAHGGQHDCRARRRDRAACRAQWPAGRRTSRRWC